MNEIPYENALIIMSHKRSKVILIWTSLSIILIFIAIFFVVGYSFHPEEHIYGYIQKNEEYQLITYIKRDEVSLFQNYRLRIEEEEIPFQVEQIGQPTVIDNEIYCEIILKVEMKEEWKIINNILSIVVEKPKTTWFQKLKKGMKL